MKITRPEPLLAAAICALWACSPVLTAAGEDAGRSDAGGDVTPHIRVFPEQGLAFGQVAWFASHPTRTTRTLTIFNGGSGPLKIRGWSLRSLTDGTSPEELRVEAAPGSDPDLELDAIAGRNVIELDVHFTPRSPGDRQWVLTLASNDPVRPELEVRISARAIVPPSCQFTVSPARVQLPPLAPPSYVDVPVVISNHGTARVQRCLVSNVHLAPESPAGITLRAGQLPWHIIEAGDALEVIIRISSTEPLGESGGALLFSISSEERPEVRVPIDVAVSASSCLTVAPSSIDFGLVRVGCQSPSRTFNLYNTCSSDLLLTGLSVTDGAGQQSGGPDCPGPQSCPEFKVVQAPAIPAGGLRLQPGAAPLTFKMRYAPIDLATDTGTVAIHVQSDTKALSYVASLTGTADMPGVQTDVFVQDPAPKVDLLLVIDNASSMANEQVSVSSNLQSLLHQMLAAKVDFHVAAITADHTLGAAFLSESAHPDPVLSSSSANLESQFAARVNVWTNGGGAPRCLEQALAALTPPLIHAQNAGFLRADAALSVVCITDTTDHSPRTVSDYVVDLWAIKGPAKKTMFTFSAVGGFSSTCPGDLGRLADAVSQTNGVAAEICEPDWHKVFASSGHAGFGSRASFYLTNTPDLAAAPLQVSSDGQPLAATTSTGQTVWKFDPQSTAINFEPAHVPGPGTTLAVTYRIACF